MSVSSKMRKESTESNAAQQMHNTMGIHPALGQLNDQYLPNELPSKVADSSDTHVPEDEVEAEATAATGDDKQGITKENIEESKRSSWGQPPVDSEDATPVSRSNE